MTDANDKSKIMAFRVTPQMRDRILRAATSEGMTAPDWVRYVLLREVKAAEKEMS